MLLFVAIWLIFFEGEDGEEEKAKVERKLIGWTLIFTALSISLDELAIGFSIGFVGVPFVLTFTIISLQTFVFTILGLMYGFKVKQLN